MARTYIYVLQLQKSGEGYYWYVGKTDNLFRRMCDHASGNGSAWTKRHPPQSLVEVIEQISPFDEDKMVKEYMLKYGIENVRGGSHSRIVLDTYEFIYLQRELWSATGMCLECGKSGHFAYMCPKTSLDVFNPSWIPGVRTFEKQ